MTGHRLVHAIARGRGLDAPQPPPGLVRFEAEGLALLHARVSQGALSTDLAQIEAFAAAIDRLHQQETIIPLRYGCVVDTDEALMAMIRHHHASWIAGLDEVEGCDEMGLRLLLDDSTNPPSDPSPPPSEVGNDRPGTAYLTLLQARLARTQAQTNAALHRSTALRQALVGLSRRSVVEMPAPGRERLLSLFFLVPRANREAFRLAAVSLERQTPGTLLLTGPWPPYNFAAPTQEIVDPA